MTNRILSIFILFLALTSCDNRMVADFEIINNTGSKIDSLKIEPMVLNNGNYITLRSHDRMNYQADMSGIAKTDGSYRLTYMQDGKLLVKNFGYYTNGYPIEKLTRIAIEKDTLMFDFEFDHY